MELQQLNQSEVEQLRLVSRNLADFVAMQEAAQDNLNKQQEILIRHEQALDEKINHTEQMLEHQWHNIQSALNDLHEVTSEITKPLNLARTRTILNEQIEKGDEYLQALRSTSEELVDKTKANYERLEKMTQYTVTGVSKAAKSFRIDDFKQLAEDSCKQISQTCTASLGTVSEVIKWFHWRNIGMVFGVTLFVTMVIGLYDTDQWPWEKHNEVVQQRNLARAVLNVWPDLSKRDQSLILQRATK